MIHRQLSSKIEQLKDKYPVITLTGPRQSGKTTLLKALFPHLPYVSLEDTDNRILASKDPRGFLHNLADGAFLDEVQRVPELFSYIQAIVDSGNTQFVLSGSHNFQLIENITQSLAGRTALLNLLPFSFQELNSANIIFDTADDYVYNGFYPRLHDKLILPDDFYPYYVTTYIEKDVRLIKNIENLNIFSLFIQLCAGRIGQALNYTSLANDVGISPNTVKQWISILEASYIIYLLKPYHKNFNKQLIKSPKLYFYDTGIVCSLLGLDSVNQVKTHYLKGALFENLIISDIIKQFMNRGKIPKMYFWQNKSKHEIDLIIEYGGNLFAFEIKSGMTKQENFFSNLNYWKKLQNKTSHKSMVIYGGNDNFQTESGQFISWKNCKNIFEFFG